MKTLGFAGLKGVASVVEGLDRSDPDADEPCRTSGLREFIDEARTSHPTIVTGGAINPCGGGVAMDEPGGGGVQAPNQTRQGVRELDTR